MYLMRFHLVVRVIDFMQNAAQLPTPQPFPYTAILLAAYLAQNDLYGNTAFADLIFLSVIMHDFFGSELRVILRRILSCKQFGRWADVCGNVIMQSFISRSLRSVGHRMLPH